ncbi:right-handed parallel beta-helix repeat-containing protein [bacterium]|nr:right-handed parallel beta-helix repeat-containing protein [bacterium]
MVIVLVAQAAQARVWRVERDGTGDFGVIQDAVDSSASGDTIMIGPGRYNEGRMVTTPGWTEFVRVLVTRQELTLIGAGPNQTIIGPEDPYSIDQGDDRGIEGSPYFGGFFVEVNGIAFENMCWGIIGEYGINYKISNCRFSANLGGLLCVYSNEITVSDCIFEKTPLGWHRLLGGVSCMKAEVSGCEFILEKNGDGLQTAVQFDFTPEVVFRDCNFYDGKYGLRIIGSSDHFATVWNCCFIGQSLRGLNVEKMSANVQDCSFKQQASAVFTYRSTTGLDLRNCLFTDVDVCSIHIDSVGWMNVQNCILAHGPQFTVWQPSTCEDILTPDLPHLNMTNNDWGTTDADTIASWIHTCDYIVDYIPYIGMPVGAETMNWGDLKAHFR